MRKFQAAAVAKNTGKILAQALWISVLVLSIGRARRVSAQETSTITPPQEDASAQLLERVRQLEERVKQLEEKSCAAAPPPVPSPSPPAPSPAPAAEETPVNEVAERLKLIYFGDVGFSDGKYYEPNSTFYFGEFNMFATARLTGKVSALADLLFTSNTDNTIGIDVERLILKYKQSDYFTASIGRIHTAIGYYNTAFDRGEYFQTPIGRPAMYEFDDQGGFLPMQDLGVVLNGAIPSRRLNLSYVFEVTNGRAYGAGVQPVQNNSDVNSSKAVNFGMSVKPTDDFLVGFSIRHDYLTDVNNLHISEIIPVVYAVYTGHKYEFLNEAMWVRHTLAGGGVYLTPGWYTQISRGFGKYRPYFLYSYVNAPLNDPIYGNPAEIPVVGRINGPSVGIRYDFTLYTAFKLQYQREASNLESPKNGVAAEFAFTF